MPLSVFLMYSELLGDVVQDVEYLMHSTIVLSLETAFG